MPQVFYINQRLCFPLIMKFCYKIALFDDNEKLPMSSKPLRLKPFRRILGPRLQNNPFNQHGGYTMQRFVLVLLVVMIAVGVASAQAPKATTVNLAISGMSCNGCASKVDKALRGVDGVKDVKVDLKNQSAEIVLAAASVESAKLVKAVADAGFKASVGKAKSSVREEDCSSCEEGSDCAKEGTAAKKDEVSGKKEEGCCKETKKTTGNN